MKLTSSLLPSVLSRPAGSHQKHSRARSRSSGAAARFVLLFCIVCLPLGGVAQDQRPSAVPESSAVLGQPKRLFPREALQLPNPTTRYDEPQPIVRRVLDDGGAATFTPARPLAESVAVRRPEISEQKPIEATDQSYMLVESDKIKVTVFQEPDMCIDSRVGKDGTITMPYIGTIRVAGKTVRDATRVITELLDDGYLVNPQVSITLVEFSKRQFTILGQVRNPGRYAMHDDEPITLDDAIGLAGGWGPSAKKNRVIISRQIGGKNHIIHVDATAPFRKENAKPFIIQPDDTITVDATFF